MTQTIVYPGTFDPITLGHLDIIERAASRFERVIIAIGTNEVKQPLLPETDRIHLVKQVVAPFNNVEVQAFKGLLVDFVRQAGASLVLRGLRNGNDFDFEQQLANMNRTLAPTVETLFMLPSLEYQSISSTQVRAIVRLGGDISAFVPKAVLAALEV